MKTWIDATKIRFVKDITLCTNEFFIKRVVDMSQLQYIL